MYSEFWSSATGCAPPPAFCSFSAVGNVFGATTQMPSVLFVSTGLRSPIAVRGLGATSDNVFLCVGLVAGGHTVTISRDNPGIFCRGTFYPKASPLPESRPQIRGPQLQVSASCNLRHQGTHTPGVIATTLCTLHLLLIVDRCPSTDASRLLLPRYSACCARPLL